MSIITKESLFDSYKRLRDRSKFDLDYLFMIVLSSIICFFGFRMDSPSVIIGSMLVSPLLYSVVSVSSAPFFRDRDLFIKKFVSLIVSIGLISSVSFLLTLLLEINVGKEITERIFASGIDYFIIAVISGIAGTFAFYWPKILESVIGIAISVALIPPIVLVGISLGLNDGDLLSSSIDIVLLNILGVFIGSVLTVISFKLFVKKSK